MVSMRPHDPGTMLPVCTDSILPPVADGLMFLAASALAASDIYAHRYDRSYCGPDANGARPIDGCGYGGEASIGAPIAIMAGASMVVGANRHSECHAAYDIAETAQIGIPKRRIERARLQPELAR